MSTVLWVQLLGRGTRPSPETGKTNCLVLDFAANTRRLGPINDPVLPRKKGKKAGSWVPYKTCEHCGTYNHTRARFCISCQAEFPETFKASADASTNELIKQNQTPAEKKKKEPAAVVESEYTVGHINFSTHESKDPLKPPSLRVTYFCGNRTFNEWLCFEHTGFALKKARLYWQAMGGGDAPVTVADALSKIETLRIPRIIRVRESVGNKYPDVIGYDINAGNLPTTQVTDDGATDFSRGKNSLGKTLEQAISDDDIPF